MLLYYVVKEVFQMYFLEELKEHKTRREWRLQKEMEDKRTIIELIDKLQYD